MQCSFLGVYVQYIKQEWVSCCVSSVVIGQDALVGSKTDHQFALIWPGLLNRGSKNGVQRKMSFSPKNVTAEVSEELRVSKLLFLL